MDVTGVLGGLWADREGYLDTTGTVHAYAAAARKHGAEVVEHNRVLELNQRADDTWDVVTEQGTVHAEHVVNAAGLWAKQVGRMVGLELPLSPLAHHYFVTDTIPEVAALDADEEANEPAAENGWEERAMVRIALRRLPAHYREVLLLRFAEDLPFAEVADALDISLEAAKSRYRRAVAALAAEMGVER